MDYKCELLRWNLIIIPLRQVLLDNYSTPRPGRRETNHPKPVLGEFVSENRKFVPFLGVKLTQMLSQALRFCPSHGVWLGNHHFISGEAGAVIEIFLLFVQSNIFI